jgi:chemotaxis protein CheD
MEQIVVGMADCRVADVPGQLLATYALGSCIALVVHDPSASIGGILHFMLPDRTVNPERTRENPFVSADTGIPLFLQRLYERGVSKRRLAAYIAGGAQIVDRDCVFEIGKRNHLAARKTLWKSGILVHGEAVGGSSSRSIKLEIGTGRLWLIEYESAPAPGLETERWHIVS